VRNVATVGGALAHADPHMDLPPVLAALDARVQIAGPLGTRELTIDELISGYYETALKRNEIITGVQIPASAGRAAGRCAAYLKCTTRAADDWPALGVAVSFLYSNRTISDARVVIGAATDRPTRARAAEALLSQSMGDATTLQKAGDALAAEVQFTTDAQGSAAYKRQLARVHLGRAVNAALAQT
jgi:carbon-monoxide dehydrogenase medium subunit